ARAEVLLDRDELRDALLAGLDPGAPEVDDHDLAAELVEGRGLALQRDERLARLRLREPLPDDLLEARLAADAVEVAVLLEVEEVLLALEAVLDGLLEPVEGLRLLALERVGAGDV